MGYAVTVELPNGRKMEARNDGWYYVDGSGEKVPEDILGPIKPALESAQDQVKQSGANVVTNPGAILPGASTAEAEPAIVTEPEPTLDPYSPYPVNTQGTILSRRRRAQNALKYGFLSTMRKFGSLTPIKKHGYAAPGTPINDGRVHAV
jgi:hypothetical protein